MKIRKPQTSPLNPEILPDVTFVVPCYNEKNEVLKKLRNTLSLRYPKDKLRIFFVTDGSDDGTEKLLEEIQDVRVFHKAERKGKAAAMNRVIRFIDTPVVCFSDANTILPDTALEQMMLHYQDSRVGAVSGEKKILTKESENASGAGEGAYWKYESFLKKVDSDFHSLAGAPGELISMRTHLYETLEEDSILDDFMLSMRIAAKGYKVLYEPKAYAMETASASVKEELKRKIRICAGGWQSMIRLRSTVTPFRTPRLFFLYFSHRVLRWSLIPLFLLLLIPLNIVLYNQALIYKVTLWGQIAFYLAAFLGAVLQNTRIKRKSLFIPYYFYIMNYAVFAGLIRYIKGKQQATWERAKRA